MSLQNKFMNFHDAIKLGRQDLEYTTARLKDDSITAEIKKRFKEDGYPVIEDFIQGSLATSTGIREKGQDFDIDRAIVIEADLAPENPITPKLAVLEVLEDRGFKNAKIKSLVSQLITKPMTSTLTSPFIVNTKTDSTSLRLVKNILMRTIESGPGLPPTN